MCISHLKRLLNDVVDDVEDEDDFTRQHKVVKRFHVANQLQGLKNMRCARTSCRRQLDDQPGEENSQFAILKDNQAISWILCEMPTQPDAL